MHYPVGLNMKLSDLDNSCAPTALNYLTDKSEEEVINACFEHGYRPNRGMYLHEREKAQIQLGIKTRYMPRKEYCEPDENGYFKKMTVLQFTKKFQTGVYLIRVSGHVFVIDNGKIVDPYVSGNSSRKKIIGVDEVLNPAKSTEKVPFTLDGLITLQVVDIYKGLKPYSKRWKQISELHGYMKRACGHALLCNIKSHKFSVADIIKNTSLKAADLVVFINANRLIMVK